MKDTRTQLKISVSSREENEKLKHFVLLIISLESHI